MDDSKPPRVSVVVPTYKLAHLLPQTLQSVRRQTLHDFEVVVADDGSPDDVLAAAKPFMENDARFRYVRQANRGLPGARNFGYRHCHPSSQYVMFLDADDVLEPTALAEMATHLDDYPVAGMVHCPAQRIDELGNPIGPNDWPRGWAYGPRLLGINEKITPFEAIYVLSAAIICSLTMLRRTVYDQTGGFDEDFGHHHEDANVFISMGLKSQVHYLPSKLVRYRIRSGQMSSDSRGLELQAERLYRKWTSANNLSPADFEKIQSAESFRTSDALQFAWRLHGARLLWQQGNRFIAFRVWFGLWRRRMFVGYPRRKQTRV